MRYAEETARDYPFLMDVKVKIAAVAQKGNYLVGFRWLYFSA